ncbi:hypothetical protein [Leminorella richardii]|uniref:hypothetical protein n=1 Tax=Leminorella richardii TaxID=158841 RepID=UPI0039EC5273
MNNVETLCNVPAIVQHGPEWYRGLSAGKSQDAGTKLMGFSGRVKNPGLWELPFASPLANCWKTTPAVCRTA